ncbi:hypothetical protein FQN54_009737 [Arachnomyces sp. PD_36]|nr:hypothetical protein FQN54_009737 [Arachnomyces sp. PD_36]
MSAGILSPREILRIVESGEEETTRKTTTSRLLDSLCHRYTVYLNTHTVPTETNILGTVKMPPKAVSATVILHLSSVRLRMHKDLQDEGDETPIPVVPPLSEDDSEYDPEALDGILNGPASYEQAQTLPVPVWLRESSSSFHWRWVPLPIRNAARATAKWVKGPQPPRELRIKPLFPKIQEAPVKLLDRFFPKRKYKLGLLSYSGKGCGLNGNDCRPFTNMTVPFRCPANCKALKVLEPHAVGNQTLNYQSLVIGGPDPGSSSPGVYRADSFICQSAVHAGAISNAEGGCGVVELTGTSHSYPASKAHGVKSAAFDSTFPKSFSFLNLPSSQKNCPSDPRWPLLGITIAALVVLSLFCTSAPVFFFTTFFMLIMQIGLVSDPPNLSSLAELLSLAFSRLLPASFIAYVLYIYCARPLLKPLESPTYQFTKTFLYLPTAFIGALNNYTFAVLIPIQRLTPEDIREQPGAPIALACMIVIIISIVLGQAWHIRQAGMMPHYLRVYISILFGLLILLVLPGFRLRIHHYILAILLMYGTAFPTRPSLIYQGLLLGLFVNGVARWGFASIIQTPSALGEIPRSTGGSRGWWGATSPNITSDSVTISLENNHTEQLMSYTSNSPNGNGNITFSLWDRQRMDELDVDGVSVLVNDVERWRAYLDEDEYGEFVWHRHGREGLEIKDTTLTLPIVDEKVLKLNDDKSDEAGESDSPESDAPVDLFFRFSFLRGAQHGRYGGAGVWLKDGSWISPPPPAT